MQIYWRHLLEWYKHYSQWRKEGLREENGVVVGSDRSQEWLLPWWWENFTKHNHHPVTFVDFGLSAEKKEWCLEKGELVSLPFLDFLVKDKEEVVVDTANGWETHYGDNFWQYRKAWFKKPLACLQSPYKKTVWLDLDCEVLGPIQDLFTACEHPSGIAIAKDQISDTSATTIYNSGVIAFQRNATLLAAWAEHSLENNGAFRGDQDLLSQIIFDSGTPVCELPARYNWNIGYGLNPEAVICHWIGDKGKNVLRDQLILKELTQ